MKAEGDPHNLTFLGALKEIASGNPDLVDESTYQDRIDTCLTCSERAPINVCRMCKCVIPLKAKFTRSECPAGRWPK